MERERAGPQVDLAEQPAETDRLAVLLGHARGSTGSARASAAMRINALLRVMRAPGNEAVEADVILAGLEQKLFHDLVDGQGVDCRQQAVETLLATGFPHALKVSPEDLAYARAPTAQTPTERVRPRPRDDSAPRPPDALAPALAAAAIAQLVGALIAVRTGGAAVGAIIGALVLGFAARMAFLLRANDERYGSVLLGVIGAGIGILGALSAREPLLAGGAWVLGAVLFLLMLIHQHRWE